MIEFHCEHSPYTGRVNLFAREKRGNGIWMAKPLEFARTEPSLLAADPLVSIDWTEAQLLADTLWAAGLRPTQGKQSEGVTGALSAHLDDMRAIAFHKLGMGSKT